MTKKLLIWDFDGVIVGSWELAYEMTRKRYPKMSEAEHRALFNGNIFSELKKRTDHLFEFEDEKYQEYMQNVYYPRKGELAPIPGINEEIKKLADNYTMVINSSSRAEVIGQYLTKNNLMEYFQKIYGTEISLSKEEKFKMILEEYQASPADCVMITDTVGDVLEARTYNIPSIVALWGYQLKEHFEHHSTIELVEDPRELAKAVNKHFGKN